MPTKTKPKIKKGKKTTPKPKKKDLEKGCGIWYFWINLVTAGEPFDHPNGTTESGQRVSADNVVDFFPNPNNDCEKYAFIQFAKHTVKKLDKNGNETGETLKDKSHDWRPDTEEWKNNEAKKSSDLRDFIYNGDKVRPLGKWGLRREDGPGFSYPFSGRPRNLKFEWEFKVYVLCDEGAKVVGFLEFSFSISVNQYGHSTLNSPNEGEEGYPELTEFCCNVDNSFYDWISQWAPRGAFDDLPRNPEERKQRLKEMQTSTDEEIEHPKSFINTKEAEERTKKKKGKSKKKTTKKKDTKKTGTKKKTTKNKK